MKEYVARHSAEEGYPESRLPEFGQVWVDYIKGKNLQYRNQMKINHFCFQALLISLV
jgi:hypothetical protein